MHLLLRPLFTMGGTQTLSNWRPVARLMKYDVAEFYKCFDSNFFFWHSQNYQHGNKHILT